MSNLLAWEALQELGGFTFIYFILGYGLVFVGIFILIGALWLLKTVLPRITSLLEKNKERKAKRAEAKKAKKSEEKTQAVLKTEEVKTQDNSDEIPEHVRVAIVAAIAAYYEGEQQKKCDFKVRRIKRI